MLAEFGWRLVEADARWVLRTTATGGAVVVLLPALDSDVRQALKRVEQGQFDLKRHCSTAGSGPLNSGDERGPLVIAIGHDLRDPSPNRDSYFEPSIHSSTSVSTVWPEEYTRSSSRAITCRGHG